MVKMIDVAKHAEVSVKTVSRVLNNEPHVQEKLRHRVLNSVHELGYIPSASARNLRSRRSYAIHFITHSFDGNFIQAVQTGAFMKTQDLGYSFLSTLLDKTIAFEPKKLKTWCKTFFANKKPDGIILIPPYTDNEVVNRELSKFNVPIVRVGPNNITDKNFTVMIDDRSAAKLATQHLIDLGHKRIAFIRGIEDQGATEKRFNGYSDALMAANIPLDETLIFSGEFDFESGMLAGEKILALNPKPTAVFAASDDMAAGVIVSAHKNNIKIPDELSIIGFDDSELARKMWPALTTIKQPQMDFGSKAAEILITKAGNATHQHIPKVELLDYNIIIRDSTAQR